MITITQGPPAEHQVWIMAGVVTYLIAAPLIIGGACLLGLIQGRRLSAEQNLKNEETATPVAALPDAAGDWKYAPPAVRMAEAHLGTAA